MKRTPEVVISFSLSSVTSECQSAVLTCFRKTSPSASRFFNTFFPSDAETQSVASGLSVSYRAVDVTTGASVRSVRRQLTGKLF